MEAYMSVGDETKQKTIPTIWNVFIVYGKFRVELFKQYNL
jgi:hypothetical protein